MQWPSWHKCTPGWTFSWPLLKSSNSTSIRPKTLAWLKWVPLGVTLLFVSSYPPPTHTHTDSTKYIYCQLKTQKWLPFKSAARNGTDGPYRPYLDAPVLKGCRFNTIHEIQNESQKVLKSLTDWKRLPEPDFKSEWFIGTVGTSVLLRKTSISKEMRLKFS